MAVRGSLGQDLLVCVCCCWRSLSLYGEFALKFPRREHISRFCVRGVTALFVAPVTLREKHHVINTMTLCPDLNSMKFSSCPWL
jgi:hypothetical protein